MLVEEDVMQKIFPADLLVLCLNLTNLLAGYAWQVFKPDRDPLDRQFLPKIWLKKRDKIWKRQFVYTG